MGTRALKELSWYRRFDFMSVFAFRGCIQLY